MTSGHSVSSNNSFKSHLNAKNFNMFLTLQQLCAARDSASVSVARMMWMYNSDVNSDSGENWKNPHPQQYQQKHHLMVILMKKLLM